MNSVWLKVKEFAKECMRVLRITKKPDKTEFLTIVKASGLGILLVGLVGFLIQMVKVLFFT
jgi:protein transport protein SEC61 subunit gamma-like protein